MTTSIAKTTRAEDVRRWMDIERGIKSKSVRFQEERAARLEAMTEDDRRRIAEVFDLFDYDKHRYLPISDLGMLLKAIGCDETTCASIKSLPSTSTSSSSSSSQQQQQAFTLEDLMPVALQALAVGRDGYSEESTRAAFQRFCTPSYKEANTKEGGVRGSHLSLDEKGLKAAFLHCGARISDDEVAELLLYADLDGDGVVGEEDWMEVMRFVMDTQ